MLTEFRGRGNEVRVYPLCFSEYVSAYSGDKYDAWMDYYTYGGLPLILSRKTDELKSKYLIDLCRELYLKDIEERHRLRRDNNMATLVNILASAVGSLTNPTKLANTFGSKGMNVSDKTVGIYIGYLLDAFIICKAERYGIKGKNILLPLLNIISLMWGCAMPSLTSDSRKKTILWRILFTTSC